MTEQIPIVMVVDRADAIERAVAGELGVLDYVVKPFASSALLARVEATFDPPAKNGAGYRFARGRADREGDET